MTFRTLHKFFAFSALLLALALAAGQAQAHLIISPQRFVFENKVRSQTVFLMNGDTKAHTYRLGWRLMKMSENGQYEPLPPDNNPHSVAKMVVFSPRQVTLAPGGKQNVRLSLRAPADLPQGEYRAHLQFDELAEDDPNAPAAAPEGQSLSVKMVLSITVPVIVRAGDLPPGEITIDAPQLQALGEGTQPTLKLDLGHTPGVGSVYGQVIVKAADEQVGILNNVAIYPEMSKRTVNVPLTRPLQAGTNVVVSYLGDGEYKGRTLATKQVTLAR